MYVCVYVCVVCVCTCMYMYVYSIAWLDFENLIHAYTGSLMYLNEATLLNNLRIRYNKDLIYVSNEILINMSVCLSLCVWVYMTGSLKRCLICIQFCNFDEAWFILIKLLSCNIMIRKSSRTVGQPSMCWVTYLSLKLKVLMCITGPFCKFGYTLLI